jgi:ribonucleotide monophosphatase NagD (HAD superfamily)
MYLKVNNFPKDKKVYVIGGEGVLEELQIAGFTGLGGPVSSLPFVICFDQVMFWSL